MKLKTLIPLSLALSLTALAGGAESSTTLVKAAQQTNQTGPQDLFSLMNQHADLRSPINANNVGQLKLAWTYDAADMVTHAPLVQGNRLYFADWGARVYAVDANTGKPVWKTEPLYKPMKQWPWHGLAGTGALGEGKLFQAGVEGEAFALDQNTGKVLWRTRFAEDPQAGNVGNLLYHNGLVFIGLQSVEEPLSKMKPDMVIDFRGEVVALDASTGKVVWRRNLVTPPHNGVAVWSSFALDPQANMLYFNTGNNYTGEPTELSDAMIAVNAKTGAIIWASQTTEHDVWTMADPKGPDYDYGAGPQLFDGVINGQPRKLVGAGQKSGIYYVWDRVTGEPLWQHVIGYGGIGGGIHAEASVGDGRIYVWSNNAYPYGAPPEKHPLNVKALDAATGKLLWAQNSVQPATLATAGYLAGDVYFVPSLDGQVRGYRASDGKMIWKSQKHPAIGSDLNVANGNLYFGTGVPKTFGGQGQGRVVAYRLGAQGQTGTSGNTPAGVTTAAARSQQAQGQQTTQNTVVIRNYEYMPETLRVKAGTTVTWRNEDVVPHTVTSRQGNTFDSGIIPTGGTWTYTFKQPGTYEYYCTIHPNMRAKVIVTGQ